MPTRAQIAARKAAAVGAKAAHDAYVAQFRPAIAAVRAIPELQSLASAFDVIDRAHDESAPFIAAAVAYWDAAVPSD